MNNQHIDNAKEINLLEMYQAHDGAEEAKATGVTPLVESRIGSNPRLLVLFTQRAVRVPVHHLKSVDYKGFLRCNEDPCTLCSAGFARWVKLLFPVYDPLTRRVELLPVEENFDPGSALALLRPLLKPDVMSAMLIRQTNFIYTITEREMLPSMNPEPGVLEKFLDEWGKGMLDLASIYKRMDNDQLKAFPEVAMVL